MACLQPTPPSPVGSVGEWALKEGVQCEWVIEGKMGEDNNGLSKLTVVRWAQRLFITVYHFYSWHLNVRESGNRRRGTDSRRGDTGGGLGLHVMSWATEGKAGRNRVGNRACVSMREACVDLSDWFHVCKSVCVCVRVQGLHLVFKSTLTCSTQTPDPSSGAQRIMVLSMEAESRLRGCCMSPPAGGDKEALDYQYMDR